MPDHASYPETCAHRLFEEQVESNPDAVALMFGAERMSYAALNARANRIAHGLVAKGAKPGQCVAMLLERSFDQVAVALAILKAGAAYVPLDPTLPPERIAQMVDDVQPPVVVSADSFDDLLTDNEENPGIEVDLESLAYVIFTSGSTGRPKGVEMPHRGLVRLVKSAQDYIRLDRNSVLLQMASISFDVSVFEIWGMLLNGGALALCPHKVPTMEQVGRLLAEHRVNILLMTAAFFHLVVKEDPHIYDPLEYLMVGGEALSAWHVGEALRELPNLCLMNAYGPTENSVNSTVHVFDRATFDPAAPVPIGRPVANTTAYILDRHQGPVPVGVTGELVVGGDGVARGYAARPDLTAERFLPDPFSKQPGARMYRTGDQACWNPKGEIEFIGRLDNQVKLRGFRMELGEIEASLAEHPEVEQAVVVLYEDDARGKWLCGFIQVEDPASFSADGLKEFARSKLPEYMVPSALVPLKEWRFTPNGKIDRKALPKPDVAHSQEEVAYESATEEAMAELWKELLGLNAVPRNVGFFELGGDSLLAVNLFLKIHQRFGRDYTLSTLLEAPTLAALAREIDGGDEGGGQKSLKLIRQGDASLPPLFWFHGGDGHVLLFKHFAENYETNQTIYAFQYAGLDGRPGEPSVEEMAQAYLAELLEVHPRGKVRLGGYCIGGYVVMEVARLLKATEVEVLDPLVVAGSPNVRARSFHPREPESSAQSLVAFRAMCDAMEAQKVVADAPMHRTYDAPNHGWLKQTQLYAHARRMRTWNRLMKMTQAARNGEPIEPASRGWYCGNITTLAGERHRSRGYDGDILYFRSGVCHGSAMNFRGWWSSLFMGFEELCRGNFEGIVVGGLHEDMLKRPEVAAMVKDRFDANDE
ncbi:Linear gramicidin synthase subunit B [Pontiella desulfatans]|uniref:Linear gramicidin synthase subunit B n=1 Tax=Pontiella desulfatans TaxID=2750659 RepID=A0A6C2U434_PONDE|nr:amino acid adenylation domain-containing protein [Pontiella desulfatans]VGO14818.1 Linear gramicidin synthase subunit B [Pontiella desulfatans]